MLAFTRLVVLFGIISLSGCDPKNQVKSKIEPIFKNDQEILSRQVLMYIKRASDFHYADAQMFYKRDSDISRFGFWTPSGEENKYNFWLLKRVKQGEVFEETWEAYATDTGESRKFQQHAIPVDAPWLNEFRGIALTHEPTQTNENSIPQTSSKNPTSLQQGYYQVGQTINLGTQLPDEVRAYGGNGELIFSTWTNQFGRAGKYWLPVKLTINNTNPKRLVRIYLRNDTFSKVVQNPIINNLMHGQ